MDKGGNIQPLGEPSSAKTVNLFDRQWTLLDAHAREVGLSRSEVLRRAVDFYVDSADAPSDEADAA